MTKRKGKRLNINIGDFREAVEAVADLSVEKALGIEEEEVAEGQFVKQEEEADVSIRVEVSAEVDIDHRAKRRLNLEVEEVGIVLEDDPNEEEVGSYDELDFANLEQASVAKAVACPVAKVDARTWTLAAEEVAECWKLRSRRWVEEGQEEAVGDPWEEPESLVEEAEEQPFHGASHDAEDDAGRREPCSNWAWTWEPAEGHLRTIDGAGLLG